MIYTELKKHKLVIVGQHFFWRGAFHQRIGANVFSNVDEIEALFIQNGQMHEDYNILQNHEDPVVRKLVAMNLESLPYLVKDCDPAVALLARDYLACRPRAGVVVL
ncbi:hypothetical protein SM033_00184 [Vibrio phage vB_VpaM_sm033]|nr:hypothetical protein SM033_00184 [Vibrio phage vB_VpaM_sm033]